MKYKVTMIVLLSILAMPLISTIKSGIKAQDKPTPVPAPTAQTLPTEAQNKIMKLQLRQAEIATEYNAIQTHSKDLGAEFNSNNAQIDAIVKDALKEMKLDPTKYDVDAKTLTVAPKPKPMPAASPTKTQ